MIERYTGPLGLAVLLLAMLPPPAAAEGSVQDAALSPVEAPVPRSLLLAYLAEKSTFALLDARSPEEYAESHIEGAINIPHDRVDAHSDRLPAARDGTVVVYCRTGKRAGRLRAQLIERGYSDVRVLQPEQVFSTDNLMVFNCGASTSKSLGAAGTAATDAREEE